MTNKTSGRHGLGLVWFRWKIELQPRSTASPDLDEETSVLNHNSACSCWGQGLCQDNVQVSWKKWGRGLLCQFAGGNSTSPADLGLATLFQSCSFVKKFSSHLPTSDSEQRGATFRFISSRDFLFCFYSFNGEGKDFSSRGTSCSWEKIKKIISFQICLSFEKGSNLLTFPPLQKRSRGCSVLCIKHEIGII